MSEEVIGETSVEIIDDGEQSTAVGSIEAEEGNIELPSDAPKEGEEAVPKTKEATEEATSGEEPKAPKSLIEEYSAKFEEAGEITEEMYTELADKGYDKDTVDTLKAGIEANNKVKAIAVLETAGTTPDEFSKATEWAKENWDGDKISEFNEAIGASDGLAQKLLIQSLMGEYTSGNTTPNEPIHSGANNVPQSTQGYADMEEMIRDMSDPRYDIQSYNYSPAYYDKVRVKASKSKF